MHRTSTVRRFTGRSIARSLTSSRSNSRPHELDDIDGVTPQRANPNRSESKRSQRGSVGAGAVLRSAKTDIVSQTGRAPAGSWRQLQLPAGWVSGESGGGLGGLQDLFRLEQVEGVVHDLHELHRPGLVDDEVGPLRIAEHRALFIGLHRAVRGEHLTPEIGEEELLAALILLPR